LLKPFKRSKGGQAIVEILPAIIIFFTVLMAGLAYFRVMRAAVIRQEVVRNAIFATIHNSGSLTTPPNLMKDAGAPEASLSGAGVHYNDYGRVVAGARMAFVDNTTTCFRVLPKDATVNIATPLLGYFMGSSGAAEVKIRTYAVVHRVYDGTSAQKCTTAGPLPGLP
jgi:hypothetical protein